MLQLLARSFNHRPNLRCKLTPVRRRLTLPPLPKSNCLEAVLAAREFLKKFPRKGVQWLREAVHLCGLTFELTPTAEAGRLARVVQHKPARRTGKLACRSGSVLSEGLGLHAGRSAPGAQTVPERAVQVRPPGARVQKRRCLAALKRRLVQAAR